MPLTYNNELREITGIYQGQTAPVTVLPKYQVQQVGPHLVLFKPGYSDLRLEAYFDPGKSARILPWERYRLSYLQIGEFCLNNIPIPLREYLSYVEVPEIEHERSTDHWNENNKRSRTNSSLIDVQWVDTPKEVWGGELNKSPFYTLWSAAKKKGFGLIDSCTYPQDFGSTVRFPETDIQANQYLVPYLNKHLVMDIGKFPSNYDPNNYLNGLDTDDLVPGGKLRTTFKLKSIDEEFTEEDDKRFREGYAEVYAALDELTKQVSTTFRVTALLKGLFFGTQNRIYVKFSGHSKLRGGDETVLCELLVYPREPDADEMQVDGVTYYAWSYLDEDAFEDEVTYQIENGPININALNRNLADSSLGVIADFVKRSRLPKPVDIELSYKMRTYACQWFIDQNGVRRIRPLEGFLWEAKRSFDSEKEAQPLKMDPHIQLLRVNTQLEQRMLASVVKSSFKTSNVQWH